MDSTLKFSTEKANRGHLFGEHFLSRGGSPGTVNLFSTFLKDFAKHMKVLDKVQMLKFDGQV